MKLNINLTKFTDYFILYLLLAFSGIPFFYKSKLIFLLPTFAIITFIYILKQRRVDKFIIIYLVFFGIIQLGHVVKFNFFPIDTIIGIYIRILFAYFVLSTLGSKFVKYYVNIMYTFAIISFIFYFFSYIPPFANIMKNSVCPLFKTPFASSSFVYYPPSIILYTFQDVAGGIFLRNSGPFWEPGAFASFLVISLLFQLILDGSFKSRKSKVLIFALVTTFSTTGLIALGLLMGIYLFTTNNAFYKVIILPLFIIAASVIFTTSDLFIGKVTEQMNFKEQTWNTRFGSAYLDWVDFSKNPLLGLGNAAETRFKNPEDSHANHRNNGVTYHLATWGLIVFVVYFTLIYYSFKIICKLNNYKVWFSWFALFFCLLIGFSEVLYGFPFFFGLTMFHTTIIHDG